MTEGNETLGTMIKLWRDRLTPAAVGLPSGRSRRTTGLRREELADLTGISMDYVVRLEQGRAVAPSLQVLAALARALHLTATERDHLYRLAGQIAPTDTAVSDHIPPGVQRVITRLGDTPAAVFAADWRMIQWNRAWAALFGDPSVVDRVERNFALETFASTSSGRRHLTQWPVTSPEGAPTIDAAVVSDLRRATGMFPHDPRLIELVRRLRAGSSEFDALWARGTVGSHREARKIVHHPAVGPVEVDCDILSDGDGELKIVIMTAVPDSVAELSLRLALVSGTGHSAEQLMDDAHSRNR